MIETINAPDRETAAQLGARLQNQVNTTVIDMFREGLDKQARKDEERRDYFHPKYRQGPSENVQKPVCTFSDLALLSLIIIGIIYILIVSS